MLEAVQKFWREGGFIVGVVAVALAWFDMKATAGEAKSIMEKQTEINAKLEKIISATRTELEVYLKVYGFDDEIAREWSRMLRDVPTDEQGRPIAWRPWLEVTYDTSDVPVAGVRYMVDDSSNVLIDTLWDFRDE
jgi:hypothetical protein